MNGTFFAVLAVLLTLIFATGCSRHTEKAPDAVPIPGTEVKDGKVAPDLPKEGVMKPTVAVRPLGKGEEVTCRSACEQILYCNLVVYHKEPQRKDMVKCIRTCKQMTTDTDKIRTEILKECVGKHRGDDCQGLRKCMVSSLKAAKARLKEMKKEREATVPMR